jgi:hypothetical protein
MYEIILGRRFAVPERLRNTGLVSWHKRITTQPEPNIYKTIKYIVLNGL